jgi:hypothetical protein
MPQAGVLAAMAQLADCQAALAEQRKVSDTDAVAPKETAAAWQACCLQSTAG